MYVSVCDTMKLVSLNLGIFQISGTKHLFSGAIIKYKSYLCSGITIV